MPRAKYLIRIAAAFGMAMMLSGCVVEPLWGHHHHHYGYYGR
jgi:hypothetical protein